MRGGHYKISDSETDQRPSTKTKSSNSGLLPRKENYRQYKNQKLKAAAKTEASETQMPVIDNPINSNESTSKAEQIHDMNITLNTLMALIMDNQDKPTLEESSSMETEALAEGEIQEDGLNYFKSISQKNDKQGPSINNDLALGVTEILKSGLQPNLQHDSIGFLFKKGFEPLT